MAVFRLDPIDELRDSRDWELSTVGAMTCYVQACDAWEAKLRITLATGKATIRRSRYDDSPINPWGNITTCEPDPLVEVPDGFVLSADGRLHRFEE